MKNLNRIDDEIPTPKMTVIKKVIKSDNKDPEKASVIVTGKPFLNYSRFRVEHVIKTGTNEPRYLNGSIGVLKKLLEEKPEPGHPEKLIGVVKIFKKSDAYHNQQSAQREVKYNRLLGREVIWGIMNSKFYVFMPWIEGMSLRNYNNHLKAYLQDDKHLLPFPYPAVEKRLKMANSQLEQGELFHDWDLILGDPKASNAMVNFAQDTIELIDFDGVHTQGTKGYTASFKYLPPRLITKTLSQILKKYSQADDIFIFGHMLAELFPEFFTVEFDKKLRCSAKLIVKPESADFQLLVDLVQAMMAKEPADRPSMKQCRVVMHDLLNEYPEYSHDFPLYLLGYVAALSFAIFGVPPFLRTLEQKTVTVRKITSDRKMQVFSMKRSFSMANKTSLLMLGIKIINFDNSRYRCWVGSNAGFNLKQFFEYIENLFYSRLRKSGWDMEISLVSLNIILSQQLTSFLAVLITLSKINPVIAGNYQPALIQTELFNTSRRHAAKIESVGTEVILSRFCKIP